MSALTDWSAYTGNNTSGNGTGAIKKTYSIAATYPTGTIGATIIPEYLTTLNGINVSTAAGTDPFGFFTTIPTINGYAYNYSIKLGSTNVTTNSGGSGGYIRGISYRISVPAGPVTVPYTMTYAYAMVLENGAHANDEQPKFSATLTSVDSVITCASPSYYLPTKSDTTITAGRHGTTTTITTTLDTAAAHAEGFTNSTTISPNSGNNFDVWAQGWKEVTFDLSPYRGQTVTLTFEADNCVPGKHFSYAYVAIKNVCSGLQISGDSSVCSNSNLTYTVPSLTNATYQWTVPSSWTIVSGGTTNTINVTTGSLVGPVTVEEKNDCADLHDTLPVTTTLPVLTIHNPAAVCAPATINIKSAAVTTGSTLPTGTVLSYYSDAAATAVVTSPSAIATSGTYYIKAHVAGGCSDAIKPVVVTINPIPSVTTHPAAVCTPATANITTAAITAGSTLPAGTSLAYYSNAPATAVVASPSAITASGTYYIVARTAAGCADTVSVSVAVNPKPAVVTNAPAAACSPATINLTAAAITTGSTTGLTYSYYSNATATTTVSNAAAITTTGIYYIVGTGTGGCSDTTAVNTTINPKPTVVTTSPAAVCSPATIDLTTATVTSGSTPGLTYGYYTNAAATATATIPATIGTSGTYYIVGITAKGCISDTAAVVATINAVPVLTIHNPSAVCTPATVNITTASVTAGSTLPIGVTASYYSDAAATTVLTTASAITTGGTYYIKASTISGCSDIKPVTVTINAVPVLTIHNPSAVCTPATIDITTASLTAGSSLPIGATLSYYSDAAATVTLTSSSAIATGSTYYIKALTTSGCSDIKPVTVIINALPVLTIHDPAGVCSPATVDITPASVTSGSTLPVGTTLSYFSDAAGTSILAGASTIAISNTYYIKASTTSGCSDIKPVTVTINSLPVLTIHNPAAVCTPATIDITTASATSGSSLPIGTILSYYQDAAATTVLSNPSTTPNGTYYIKALTTSGCSDIKPVIATINQKPSLVIHAPAAVCSPATVDITPTSVTTGSNLPDAATLSYYTDAAATTVLTTAPAITTTGTYYIKAQTSFGCSDIKPVAVTINPVPVLTIHNPAAVCSPATVDITTASVTAGSSLPIGATLNYYSDAAATTILTTASAITTSGTYYIKALTSSGCSDIKPVTVTINSLPVLIIHNPAGICSPGAIDITTASVTAGSSVPTGTTLNYYSDVAATTALTTASAITSGGTYYIKALTTSGCSDIKPVIVTVNSLPVLTIHNPAAVCSPVTVDITNASVTAGSSLPTGTTLNYYSDAAATTALTTASAITSGGTYYIKALTTSGCSDIKPVIVTINPTPSLAISNPAPICASGSLDITLAARTAGSTMPTGTTLNYYMDATAITLMASPATVTTTGTYYVKAQTSSGCNDIKPMAVVVNPLPLLTIHNPAAICFPATIDITTTSTTAGSSLPTGTALGYYTDAAGSTALTTAPAISTSGIYYIKALTSSGCTDIKPVTVTINPTPVLTIHNPAAVCSPATIDITTGPVTSGSTLPGGTALSYYNDAAATAILTNASSIATSNTYYIKALTSSACVDVKPVIVIVNPTPSLTIHNPAAVCYPATVDITNASVTAGSTLPIGAIISYYSDAAGTATLTNTSAIAISGTYYIKALTTSGCSDIKPVVVTINATPSLAIHNPVAVCTPATVDITNTTITAGSILPGGATLSYYSDASATAVLTSASAIATSGTYYIKALTASGCSDVQPVTVTVNPTPSLTIHNPVAVCTPSTIDITTVSITVGSTLPAGTTLNYYSDASATTVLTNASTIAIGDTYYIKALTTSGCSDVKPIAVTVNATPSLTIHNPAAVCTPSTVDITTASVTAGSTLPGGTTLSYFSDAAATTTLTGASTISTSGTYYIKALTSSGCSDIKPVAVTINATPSLTIHNPAAVCIPATVDITNTAITAGSILPGSTTLGYYSDALATSVLTNASAIAIGGTYYIKALTTSGCSDIKPVAVTVNPTPSLTIYNPAAVCIPSTIDLTTASVTAGSALPIGVTLSYYTDAAATTNLSSASAVTTSGTYYIKASTTSGCSDIKPVTVTINATPSLSIHNPAAICTPGTVDITNASITTGSSLPTGTTLNYYSNAAATTNLSSASAVTTSGTYYIKALTASGCSDTQPVTVTVNATPSLTIHNPGAVCFPATVDITNATVTAGSTLPGGTILSYYSDATATTLLNTASAITASGTYYIKAFTTSGCSDIKPVTVTVNAAPVLTIQNPLAVCFPVTIDITTSTVTNGSSLPGGTMLSYYNDASATTTLTTASAITTSGTYYIKALTASGCSAIKPVTVTVNATPSLTIHNPGAVCFPATVDITNATVTAGSTLPVGTTLNYYSDVAATAIVSNASSITTGNTYYIKASTTSGCSDTKPVIVTVNAIPSLTIHAPSAVCYPAMVDITNASIISGSTLPSGTMLGYYSDASAATTLASASAITASGTYYIEALTTSGCSDVKPVTVTVNTTPSLTIHKPVAVCSPATIDLTTASVTAGSALPIGVTLSYYSDAAATTGLSNASTIATSSTYYIKALTTSGCSDIKPVIVTVNATPSLSIHNPVAVCTPASIDLTTASVTAGSALPIGATLNYYSDAATAAAITNATSIATGGIYYIKASTTSGCSDVKPVTVTVNATPSLTIHNPAAVCTPSTVDITTASVTAGSTLPGGTTLSYFSDAAGTTTLTGASTISISGVYYIKASTTSGCVAMGPVAATINQVPILTIHDPAAVCSPLTIDITLPAITAGSLLPTGTTLSYYTDVAATNVLSNPTAIAVSGTYYIKAQNPAGCYTITAVTTTVNATPILNIINPKPVFTPAAVNIASQELTSEQSRIPAGSVFTYYTDSAMTSQLFEPTVISMSGTYYVRVQTIHGCYAAKPVIVTIYTTPTVTIHNPVAVCEPGSVSISDPSITTGSILPAGTTYSYYTDPVGTTSVSNPDSITTSGTYYIKIQTLSGYTTIQPVTVTINPTPATPTANNQAVCAQYGNEHVEATATPPAGATIIWHDQNDKIIATPDQRGAGTSTYYAQSVNTATGCKSDSVPVTTTVVEAPQIYIENSTVTVVTGTSGQIGAQITAGSGGYTYQWSPAISGGADSLHPLVSPTTDTSYTLTATSTELAGCSSSATIHVIVVDPISIPNIFSPNGDGIHDTWIIKNIEQYPQADISIFNRYGEFLYESHGGYEDHPWDGKYDGKLVPVGAYFYIIKLNADTAGVEKPIAGCISIIY